MVTNYISSIIYNWNSFSLWFLYLRLSYLRLRHASKMDTPRVLSSLLHLSILFVFVTHFGLASNVKLLLATYNEELIQFNHAGAEIAWEMSTHLGNTNLLGNNAFYWYEFLNYFCVCVISILDSYEELILKKNLWNNDWCIRLLNEKFENISDEREVYLICRGPRFSSYQLRYFVLNPKCSN